ncbi:MAG: GNAT family N-acetyltransferase [Chloroflexi bacterium]|nr:GNAT family N-acetyltransferase [Chloroflexota bacterium]
MTGIVIEDCGPGDSREQAARDLADAVGQAEYFAYEAEWHLDKHTLVAVKSDRVVGFLRFVVQEIGPDSDRASLTLRGEPMREAYVLAFGVADDQRRRGVGTALQNELIERAATLGCLQVRSRSAGDRAANHALKLSLGFGVHPTKDTDQGVFFVLRLPQAARSRDGVGD